MSLVPDEPAVRRPALLPLVLGVPGWWLLGGILLAAALPFVPTLPWAISTRDRYATRVLAHSLPD